MRRSGPTPTIRTGHSVEVELCLGYSFVAVAADTGAGVIGASVALGAAALHVALCRDTGDPSIPPEGVVAIGGELGAVVVRSVW